MLVQRSANLFDLFIIKDNIVSDDFVDAHSYFKDSYMLFINYFEVMILRIYRKYGNNNNVYNLILLIYTSRRKKLSSKVLHYRASLTLMLTCIRGCTISSKRSNKKY